MAVVAPMPSARVRTMVREKPGAFRSWRIARRRSRIGKYPCSARGGQWISASPRDAKHQPNGKCSQLKILNVKWCERANAFTEHEYGSRGTIYPLNNAQGTSHPDQDTYCGSKRGAMPTYR